jgi:hypothetical protein
VIFWILVGIAVLIAVINFFRNIRYMWEEGLFSGFVTLLVSAFVIGFYLVIAMAVPVGYEATDRRTEQYELVALDTSQSGVEFRAFLFSSYGSGGEPGFSYLRETGREGEVVMRFAKAHQSTVHTDEEENPYVDITYFTWGKPLLVPWNVGETWIADFHVPENSVSSQITVTP